MDANLSRDKVAGFLGQSFVRIPRKVFTMLFHGKGREKSIGMAYLILISEVYFADGSVCLRKRTYTCKRGEYVGRCNELAACCGMSGTTLRRSLKWLEKEGLIDINRLEDGIFIRVCGYDFIMGFRQKKKNAEKGVEGRAAFQALEDAERLMGGRSMQFDCCAAANEEGGMA